MAVSEDIPAVQNTCAGRIVPPPLQERGIDLDGCGKRVPVRWYVAGGTIRDTPKGRVQATLGAAGKDVMGGDGTEVWL